MRVTINGLTNFHLYHYAINKDELNIDKCKVITIKIITFSLLIYPWRIHYSRISNGNNNIYTKLL